MSATTEIMSVQEVRENLDDLVKLVAQRKRRVEFRDEAGNRCVMLSQIELDSLEGAINILSNTDEFREVCTSLGQLAAATDQAAMA